MKSLARILAIAFLLWGCASQKNTVSESGKSRGDTRTVAVEYLDDDAYLLTISSDDRTYGYQQHNPIKVGGLRNGPSNERRFLNALLGPNGEPVKYHREGSCCPFKTPNGLLDNTGLLDKYIVSWEGGSESIVLYFNMYDEGDLKIPSGFTARKNRLRP
jgi:hypothetical protein